MRPMAMTCKDTRMLPRRIKMVRVLHLLFTMGTGSPTRSQLAYCTRHNYFYWYVYMLPIERSMFGWYDKYNVHTLWRPVLSRPLFPFISHTWSYTAPRVHVLQAAAFLINFVLISSKYSEFFSSLGPWISWFTFFLSFQNQNVCLIKSLEKRIHSALVWLYGRLSYSGPAPVGRFGIFILTHLNIWNHIEICSKYE